MPQTKNNKEESKPKEKKTPEIKSEASLQSEKAMPEEAGKKADFKEEKKEEEAKKEIKPAAKKKKSNIRRQIQRGRAYINSTYNNTVILMTDIHGNALAWSSSGSLGFKGAKKATTYAANQVVLDITEKIERYGLKELEVYIKGVGSGREAAIRALAQKGFSINLIKDRTPIPHNGCRPPKPRRV